MSHPPPRAAAFVAVPSLHEVQAGPTILDRLSLNILVELRRQVRHLDADLDAAIELLAAQVVSDQEKASEVVSAETIDVILAAAASVGGSTMKIATVVWLDLGIPVVAG